MPMGMGYGYYWDPTYVLVIIGAVICMIASANVSGTYKKYNRVRNSRNMTGAQVAAQILQEAGLSHIRMCRSGFVMRSFRSSIWVQSFPGR